jgi:hypothetical protein
MPPHFIVDRDSIRVETTIDPRRPPVVKYSIPQFGFSDRIPTKDEVELDRKEGVMRFRKPIIIQRLRSNDRPAAVPAPVR